MSKFNLWLHLKHDAGDELPPVKLYSSETLGRALWYALRILKHVGAVVDYSDWVKKYKTEVEK